MQKFQRTLQITELDTPHYPILFLIFSTLLGLEIICYIVLSPFYEKTSYYLFGFVFTCLGALLRFFISNYLNPYSNRFFIGTFVCNVIGSIVASVVMMVLKWKASRSESFSFVIESLISAQSVGLASALTTMSTYAKETTGLKKNYKWFVVYSWSSVLVSFGFCCLIFALNLQIYQ